MDLSVLKHQVKIIQKPQPERDTIHLDYQNFLKYTVLFSFRDLYAIRLTKLNKNIPRIQYN